MFKVDKSWQGEKSESISCKDCLTSIMSSPLKLVSDISYQIFIFSSNDASSKTMKNVFVFHIKSSFRSRDIQFFIIFPFLSTLSRFKRANGSGMIYDGINWFA